MAKRKKLVSKKRMKPINKDFSNNINLALLTVFLVIAIVGTTISVVKISNLGPAGQNYIFSGATTQSGTADLAISATVAFTINDSTIDFGSGYVALGTSSTAGAYIYSDAMADYDGATWDGGGVANWVNTTAMNDTNFLINNTGTVAILINISAAGLTHAENWYCPTDDDCASNNFGMVEAVASDIGGNCGGTINESVGYTYILNATGNRNVTLCDQWSTGSNSILNVTLNLSIPTNAESSMSTLNLIFTAIEAS